MGRLYSDQLEKYRLNVPEIWKDDPRQMIINMLEPLVEGTEFSLAINHTDHSGKVIEVHKVGMKRRAMSLIIRQSMVVHIAMNMEIYNYLKPILDLPEDRRSYKPQAHIMVQLKDVWNVFCVLTLKKEHLFDLFSIYSIDSGEGLRTFLDASGLIIVGVSAVKGAENVIKLPDLTTFNWKSKDRIIRVNCKETAMKTIEQKNRLKHIDNGPGDSTRPYSFIVETLSDLIDVIYALKCIDGNRK